MRRIILALIVLLTIQEISAQVKMGIKADPQITWASSERRAIGTGNARVNISYGLLLDYYFTENYAIGTELGVGTFGGSILTDSVNMDYGAFSGKTEDISFDYSLQYVTLPVLLKMRTKEIGYFRYYGEFGLGLGFLFRSKADFNSTKQDVSNVDVNSPDPADRFTLRYTGNATPLEQEVNFFRSSLIIGAGLQYNVFGNTLLIAGLRYDNALTDFTVEDRWKAKMNFIALHLGVMF